MKEDNYDELKALLFFIQLNMVIYIMLSRRFEAHQKEDQPTQPQGQDQAQPALPSTSITQKEKKITEPMGHALDTTERGQGMLQDSPG